MVLPVSQKHNNSKRQPSGSDSKDWSEQEPTKLDMTPERALAEVLVNIRAENTRKRLVVRSKVLLAVVALALLVAVQSMFYIVQALLHGDPTTPLLLSVCNVVLQLAIAAYFLMARNAGSAAQALRLLLILNVLVLFMGLAFALLGSSILTMASFAVQYIAYKRMGQLKNGGD